MASNIKQVQNIICLNMCNDVRLSFDVKVSPLSYVYTIKTSIIINILYILVHPGTFWPLHHQCFLGYMATVEVQCTTNYKLNMKITNNIIYPIILTSKKYILQIMEMNFKFKVT